MAQDLDDYQTQKKEIQSALNVDGFHGFLDFDDDIFLLDYWEEAQALNYLAGIADIDEYWDGETYHRITTLDQDFYLEASQPHIIRAFFSKLNRLQRIWKSGAHPQSNPPDYYIEWAISKGIDIPWLKYAITEGYYHSKTEESKEPTNRDHVSDRLAKLNQAAAKFWAKADPKDRTTHPNNADIAAWLINHEYSASLAAKAATIIRPEWAESGRKPLK